MSTRRSGIAFVLALASGGASIALLLQPQSNLCTNRPSLTILAMVSAFILALSYRLFHLSKGGRLLLLVAALLAMGTLVADAWFVLHHRAECTTAAHIQELRSFQLHPTPEA